MVVYMSYGRLVRNFWAPSTKGRGPGGMHSVQNERNGAYVLFNITKCPAKSTERKPHFWGLAFVLVSSFRMRF